MSEKTISTELAKVETGANLSRDRFQPKDFGDALKMAQWLAKSNLTPKGLQNKPQDIMVIIMAAVDSGLSVYQGLQELVVINGKVTMSARLASARAAAHPMCRKFAVIHSDREKAVVRVERNDWPEGEYVDVEFTVDQAKRANLMKKGGAWDSWLEDMLVARARTRAANQFFPEALMGFQETGAMQAVAGEMVDAVPPRGHYEEPASKLEALKERVVETAPSGLDEPVDDAEIVEEVPKLAPMEVKRIRTLAKKAFEDAGDAIDWLVERTGQDDVREVPKSMAAELEAELLDMTKAVDEEPQQELEV